jgi:digeranylgeranylglycerophospholipid reductase
MYFSVMVNQDVIIVGAGPVGLYLGWQLSKRGISVLIIESNSREKCGSKMDQFHLETHVFEKYGIPPPLEDSEEFITNFEYTSYYGPYGKYQQIMKYPITAMRFPYFIQRLIGIAEQKGLEFNFSCEYKVPIIQDESLTGVSCVKNGSEEKFYAKLIVDCSGTSAVVRTSLPKSIGVETFEIEDDEKMYVIQRVIQWLKPDEPHPGIGDYEGSISWLYYKTWVAPHFLPNANIFGGGQPGGYENAEKAAKIFLNDVPFPPYKVLEKHKATTAYRRSPYSIVGNGFLCLGDSACMSKSFSGEAIESSWRASLIVIDVITKLIDQGLELNQKNMWPINVNYFRNQGAKLAALLSQIPGAANTTKNDVSYLFKHSFIFSSRDFTSMWENQEMDLKLGRLIKIVGLFILGLISLQFSRKALNTMLKYMKISGKLRKHYEAFPEDPEEFDNWKIVADELWKPVEKMRYTLEDSK